MTNRDLARERVRELSDRLRRLQEYAMNAHLALNAGLLQEAAEELHLAAASTTRVVERVRECSRLIELARVDAEAGMPARSVR